MGKLQPDFSPVTAHPARIRRSKRAPAGERTFEGKAAESLEYETLRYLLVLGFGFFRWWLRGAVPNVIAP